MARYSRIVRRIHLDISNRRLLQCPVDSHHITHATSKIFFLHQLSPDNNASAACITKDLNYILTHFSGRKRHTILIFITQASTITHDLNFFSRFELQIFFIFAFALSDNLPTCVVHPTRYGCDGDLGVLFSLRGAA